MVTGCCHGYCADKTSEAAAQDSISRRQASLQVSHFVILYNTPAPLMYLTYLYHNIPYLSLSFLGNMRPVWAPGPVSYTHLTLPTNREV